MCTILVVDDDPTTREVISTIATRRGHKVMPAKDEEDALSLIETSTPDVISMDLNFPRSNGVDMLRRLRAAGATSFAVIVSGHRRDHQLELKEEWRDLRIFDVIEKPFLLQDLMDRLENAADATCHEEQLCALMDRVVPDSK